ncbi:Polyphenol oxidase 1 [Chamberlinius hualienensis]
MKSLATGFTVSLLLLISFGIAAEALVKEDNCHRPKDIRIKQLLVNNVVTTINKPNVPRYQDMDECAVCTKQMSNIGRLPKGQVFSLFDMRNWNETFQVIELLREAETFDDFIKKSEYIKNFVNEDLFFYAFSVVVSHRPDTRGITIPRVHVVFPDKFIKDKVIRKIQKMTSSSQYGVKRPVVVGNSMRDYNYFDPQEELSYFTEDLGMNSHHYHWHVINTPMWHRKFSNYTDRQGELFYWMHRQMMARYDAERLSNLKPRTRPIQNWHEPILEGYNPHLKIVKSQYHYAFRPARTTLKDLPELPRSKLQRWTSALYDTIDLRKIKTENGEKIDLNDEHGIDILGNTIESNTGSVNFKTYGSLHSMGHVLLSRTTDPRYAYDETYGPMYDTATAARDPLFYRWHKYLNRLFIQHKYGLKPYTKTELEFPGIKLGKITVQNPTSSPNLIRTFWTDSYLKISEGFEFTQNSPAYVKLTHLDHETFNYVLDIENSNSQSKEVVVRIFMAPIYDEFEHPLDINAQARMMIEMDKFVTKVNPGQNTITRSSENSTVTMDSRSIFDKRYKSVGDCRCGWPDYLLVPKGTFEGMPFKLFITLSDWSKEEAKTPGNCFCNDSISTCGGINAKYRDIRPMGYPYDRKIKVNRWKDFETSNMGSSIITVKFVGREMTVTPRETKEYDFDE